MREKHFPMGRELALELEIVTPESVERAERFEREGHGFWIWNTTPTDVEKVKPGGKGAPS